MDLTKSQEMVLNAIRTFTAERGYSPSVRDLCEMCGLKSTSSVHARLKSLESKGYLKRYEKQTRSLVVVGAYA